MEKTRYPDYSTVDMILRVPEPSPELPVPKGTKIIKLPSPKRIRIPEMPVRKALENWEPVGFFSRSSLTMKELSYLLWCMQGERKLDGSLTRIRNVPSSGERHPIDTYFVAGEIEDLPTGIYHYLPGTHRIAAIREDSDIPFSMGTASMNFKVITRASVTFLWIASPHRSVWALGNRGYRSIFIETGHICQALIMASACIGCRVHPIDLFHDQMMVQLMGLDPESQWPLYVAAVGRVNRDF
ncbi:MAG TPA: SagB/ThcOx family dehydrogenase [Methanoregulaceae archaeon]|nr:SagB/ThcOx family dehydrogenase [Methanoregulaceae archaeon]HPD10286.1 SagB/ThcOx family dehydrogenase [Methanoregulaceae archaeon]HRT15483.1 SagB/ThcOx family dehydrogenase [Methanoregulaceae archaeon]HRU30956.1 SagB/ThcOx family dehydrogenase [Methanoregulaceae archaeon]